MQNLQNRPSITIDNQSQSYYDFVNLLMASKTIQSIQHLRCNPSQNFVGEESGRTLNPYTIQYDPFEGIYQAKYKDNILQISFRRGQAHVTTPCKSIEYLKTITINANSIELIKQFIKYIFSLAKKDVDESLITIYQNRSVHWSFVKNKKARKIQSVILEKTVIDEILGDVREFIISEKWYNNLGIPYKRSYLLYGPPGTGKSSLAQAIAAEIKYSICYLNCSVKEINDSTLNDLLNSSPKKSIILLEDVDSIFSERKLTEKNNILTFSGFLNALDGVRSQEGRIIIMTTNYKERLDPALLRPGRTDKAYKIGLATKYQIETLCFRFYQNQKVAKKIAQKVPSGKFSMALLQGFLLKYRRSPEKSLANIDEDLLNNQQSISIQEFLEEINCKDCLKGFTNENCYTLAQAKNLTRAQIEKITMKLSRLQVSRVTQLIHAQRRSYIKTAEQLEKHIDQVAKNDQQRKQLRMESKRLGFKTFFQVKDKLSEIQAK